MNVLARLDDLAHPLLVRETRRILRGRAFPIGFGLALTGFLVIALSPQSFTSTSMRPRGDEVFDLFVRIFAFLAWVIVPAYGARWIWEERRDDTFEALSLTGLGAGGLVYGRAMAGVVQLLLLLAVFAPFATYAYLLKDLDAALVLSVVAVVLSVAVALLLAGIFVSTLATHRVGWVLLSFALVAGQLGLYGGSVDEFERALRRGRLPLADVAAAVGTAGALTFVFWAAARARLAPASTNHAMPVRLAVVAAIGVSFTVLVALPWIDGGRIPRATEIAHWSWPALALAGGVGLASLGESETLPALARRQARRIRRVRSLLAPFFTGRDRGLALAILLLALVGVVHFFLTDLVGTTVRRIYVVPMVAAYAILYLGLGRLQVDLVPMPARWRTPVHRRLAPLAIAVVCLLAGVLPYLFMSYDRSAYEPNDLLTPALAVAKVSRASGSGGVARVVALAAAIVAMANAPGIWRGLREVERA